MNANDECGPGRPEPRDPDAVERMAAAWLVRRDRGLSPAEKQEFAHWRSTDARHAAVYAEIEETWDLLPRAGEARRCARWRLCRRLRPVLAVAAAVAVVIGWHTREPVGAQYAAAAVTEAGTLRKMELPDGSLLQLNGNSAVEVRFTPNTRSIQLVRGELHLTVAKNPARPFTVRAGPVVVQAVGTAFNVRLEPGLAVDVLVTEGRVRVDDVARRQSLLAAGDSGAEGAPLLAAGQRARIALPADGSGSPEAAAVATVPAEDVTLAMAWHARQLRFVAAPLAEIVAEFNRCNSHRLVVTDDRLALQRFGGVFVAGDYETLVRMLETSFGVVAERRERETRLRLEH